MNKQNIYTKMNELKSEYVDFNSLAGSKENMFCINANENKLHRNKKYSICCELLDLGFTFFTEILSKDRLNRYDILAFNTLGDGFIIEITDSETKKSIEDKKNKYPCPPFTLIFCKTTEEFKI